MTAKNVSAGGNLFENWRGDLWMTSFHGEHKMPAFDFQGRASSTKGRDAFSMFQNFMSCKWSVRLSNHVSPVKLEDGVAGLSKFIR